MQLYNASQESYSQRHLGDQHSARSDGELRAVPPQLACSQDDEETVAVMKTTYKKRKETAGVFRKTTYKKRKGTAGASGQFYEIKLYMWFLLEGTTRTKDGTINGFHLASNMEEAESFDDVVFKYTYNGQDGTEKTKILFLQAKRKEKEKETAKRPQDKLITIGKLLSGADTDFSLQKYFTSYLMIKGNFSPAKVDDPIFGSRYEDVDLSLIHI